MHGRIQAGRRILALSGSRFAMQSTRVIRHQDYELTCSASALDSGKFVPSLVVCKQVWPTRPRTIEIRRGDYLTEETALDAAQSQGVDWIRDYG
jgi:hypothetical protein